MSLHCAQNLVSLREKPYVVTELKGPFFAENGTQFLLPHAQNSFIQLPSHLTLTLDLCRHDALYELVQILVVTHQHKVVGQVLPGHLSAVFTKCHKIEQVISPCVLLINFAMVRFDRPDSLKPPLHLR